MNTTEISIIDRGRGVQLSTSRITVQDLVPYFQEGCGVGEIRRWMPTLTEEEVAVAEAYYREHREEMDAEDRRVREKRERQIRDQRERFPEEESTEKLVGMRRLLEERRQEATGAGNPG